MNEKINIHSENSDVDSRLRYVQKWNVPISAKKDLELFLKDLGSGKVNKGIQIKQRTQVKYISLLKIPLLFINKEISKITKKDLEDFDNALSKDKLQNERHKKKPYSLNMKKDVRIALRVLLKWKFGETKSNEMTDFFDTRDIKKTPDYLKESEIEKLFRACKNNEERYIIAVLFDSGSRAEEFLNIRYEDVQLPEGKDNYVKLALKEEYSKTEGRTISLYWYKSLEAIKDYIQDRVKEGMKTNEPVIKINYDAIRFRLERLGKRVLQRSIYFHLFRHSSATFYAPKMNRQELCYRYGWKFSSDMPDVYISRAGIQNKELDEKFTGTELNTLKIELEREKTNSSIKIAELETFKNTTLQEVAQMKTMIKQFIEKNSV